MKLRDIITAAFALLCVHAGAFERTLRVDCIFSGDNRNAVISVAELRSIDGWAGRTVNMDRLLLKGNGSISLKDAASGKTIYVNSFSTLFQEWQSTEEATRMNKAFENVFLLPMPEAEAEVTIELYNSRGETTACTSFKVNPQDILIRPAPSRNPYRYLLYSGPDAIDVAIVAEGYTAADRDAFYADAQEAMESILGHEPFKSMKDRFNFVAVAAESTDSGISVPAKGDWKRTALSSHFDTFYSSRYLTTLHLRDLHDALAGIPYEHIVIIANTDTYGGGGIYNSYMLSSTRNPRSKPVIVHEFGHSFAGLADEYFYDDQFENMYFPDVEPWEPNITTLADFSLKWEKMLERHKPVSKAEQKTDDWKAYRADYKAHKVGIYEGAGYMSEGAYRPYPLCRMHVNEYPSFCPVCQEAIRNMIDYQTVELR